MIELQLPDGKGIFVWKIANYGTFGQAFDAIRGMGLNWIALKIGDAANDRYASTDANLMPALVSGLRDLGLKVWAWHYIYGGVRIDRGAVVHDGPDPLTEANFALSQIDKYKFDGYIIDAEKEFKTPGSDIRAAQFASALRLSIPAGVPIALCSYRFPRLHPEFPWAAFLQYCDLHMPQVYWGPGRPIGDLDQSMMDLSLNRKLPVVPVGRAYVGDGHPGDGVDREITAFLARAEDRGCSGAAFWALDFLKLHPGGKANQDAIGAYRWNGAEEVEPPRPAVLPANVGKVRTMVNMNVRGGPGIKNKDIGDLSAGTVLYYQELSPDKRWARIGENAWLAVGDRLAKVIE